MDNRLSRTVLVAAAAIVSISLSVSATARGKKASGFDEKNITLSVGVISDTHVSNSDEVRGKFRSALQQLKEKAEATADGLDAVIVAGDLIDNGADKQQMGMFKADYESVLNPDEVPMIYTVGNHDPGTKYAWTASMVSDVRFMRDTLGPRYFQKDLDHEIISRMECRHCIIGDYHVLCISPVHSSPVTYTQESIDWLDKELKEITENDPDRYVFVITHPMIYDTVYGSLLGTEGHGDEWLPANWYWSTKDLTPVLEKYPQAVTFGGHLHFPINDPRSIWQGKFTSFGCGSVKYAALEGGGYEDMASKFVPMNSGRFSQGYLVQFDSKGRMRVTRMDFYNHDTIGEAWTLDHPDKAGDNLGKYATDKRIAENKAPEMSEAFVSCCAGNQPVSVEFFAGTDDEFVHHYVVTLKKGDEVIAVKKQLSDFYLHPKASQMKKIYSQPLGTLPKGNYEVSIVAVDSWGAESKPITASFWL